MQTKRVWLQCGSSLPYRWRMSMRAWWLSWEFWWSSFMSYDIDVFYASAVIQIFVIVWFGWWSIWRDYDHLHIWNYFHRYFFRLVGVVFAGIVFVGGVFTGRCYFQKPLFCARSLASLVFLNILPEVTLCLLEDVVWFELLVRNKLERGKGFTWAIAFTSSIEKVPSSLWQLIFCKYFNFCFA